MKNYKIRNKNNKKEINENCVNNCEVLCYNASVPIIIKEPKKTNKIYAFGLSFLSGVINGFFGGGAGMLIVVLLQKCFKLSTKCSHATAVFVVLPLCVISLLLYVFSGIFNFNNAYFVVLGVVLGGVIGALLLKKLKSFIIGIIFAVIVIACAVKMLIDLLIT